MSLSQIDKLIDWYKENARDLPWRHTSDPYRIWISEIMLQQTRVEAVKSYYSRFLSAFPNVKSLASAEDDKLLKLWEGLGYYNRARNMKKAANAICLDFNGSFPQSYEDILKLPGIGEYTAGAISSIAFRQKVPAVDGNVLRVLSRINADPSDISLPATRKKIRSDLLMYMPDDYPGIFNQALMELGATVCLPNGMPQCDACPLRDSCKAHADHEELSYPKKSGKTKRRIEQKTIFVLNTKDGVIGYKRPDTGLLASLYQLPEEPGLLTPDEMAKYLESKGISPVGEIRIYMRKHVFTHVEWHMRVCAADVLPTKELPDSWLIIEPDIHSLPTAYRICL